MMVEGTKNGDTLPSAIESGIMDVVNEKLVPLQATIESAIHDTDSLVMAVNSVLNIETQRNLQNAIADFSAVARELKTTSRSANALIDNNQVKLENTLSNLEKVSTDFSVMSNKLGQIDLEALIGNMEKLLTDFQGAIQI